MIKNYGVIGYPLGHSLSPIIHNLAFNALGIDADYIKMEILPEHFDHEIMSLKSSACLGFNITIPYKEKIIPYLDEIEPVSQIIGAVNTVLKTSENKWKGYNTDYTGFLSPIHGDLDSIKSCLIIGAGGAARAVGFGLLSKTGIKRLDMINRSEDKARALFNSFKLRYQFEGHAMPLAKTKDLKDTYDLIVQTTSVGMGMEKENYPLDPISFSHKKTIIYDLIYNPKETIFLAKGRQRGLRTINGWTMLVGQAQDAFQIWTGLNFSEPIHTAINRTYINLADL